MFEVLYFSTSSGADFFQGIYRVNDFSKLFRGKFRFSLTFFFWGGGNFRGKSNKYLVKAFLKCSLLQRSIPGFGS
jgi:hypothetical protein